MAQLISSSVKAAEHIEILFFMDKYGKRFNVQLAMTAGPARADKIASTLAAMTATENSVDAYYAANGHDPAPDLAAGAAAIAAALAQNP